MISRHRTDYWIKNNSVDISIKGIDGNVDIHWHEFYEIELILEGSGTYCIDGIDYPIKKGSLFFMSPSSFHSITFSERTELINFMFTMEVCDFDFLCGIFDILPHVSMVLSDSDAGIIESLAKDVVNTNYIKYQMTVLNYILGKIQRMHKIQSPIAKDFSMQHAVLYIQNHFKESLTLDEVARIANYSTNYFGNKFKEYTGVTFKEYIMELKFSLAKNLLENTNLSVTEICYDCGFRDFSNFMVYFKKRYGVTPKKLRDNSKNARLQ